MIEDQKENVINRTKKLWNEYLGLFTE